MMREPHADAALGKLRVLELSDQPGQYCGKLLADMGADVIKIEPVQGSPVRRVGPFYRDDPHYDRSLTFWHYNTSKRGMCLDLDSADGREIFRRLADTADVVIESFPPGHLEALGLDGATLRETNPQLVTCSITPFGKDGPWADFTGSDLIHLALGGVMASCGYETPDNSPPIAPTGGNAYHIASHIAASSIMAALIEVERSGTGQDIEIAIHDAVAQTTEMAFHWYVYHGEVVKRQAGRHAMPTITKPWTAMTADGHFMNVLVAVTDPRRQSVLLEWMAETGDQGDVDLERLADPETAESESDKLVDAVLRFVSRHPLDYIYTGAQSRKLPWSPIRAVEDLLTDPHLTEDRKLFASVEHPELGTAFTYIGEPYKFSLSHWEIRARAPLLGEHTLEICEELEIGRDRLQALAEAGVL